MQVIIRSMAVELLIRRSLVRVQVGAMNLVVQNQRVTCFGMQPLLCCFFYVNNCRMSNAFLLQFLSHSSSETVDPNNLVALIDATATGIECAGDAL